MHETRIFFVLDTGQVEPIPQTEYAKLLRGDLALPEYANETVRLADWYVELADGRPVALRDETYSLLRFDAHGRVAPPRDLQYSEPAWLPSDGERKVLQVLVFAPPL